MTTTTNAPVVTRYDSTVILADIDNGDYTNRVMHEHGDYFYYSERDNANHAIAASGDEEAITVAFRAMAMV